MKNLNYHKIVDITMMILFPRIWICKVTSTHPATPVETQKKTFPLPLIRAIALLVSFLFSYLTATPAFGQEPVGLGDIKPLSVGDTIPKELWDMPLQVANNFEGQKTIKLADYRGRSIILDFLSTGCAGCIEALPKFNTLQLENSNTLKIILLTPESKEHVIRFASKNEIVQNNKLTFVTNDRTVKQYFPHLYISHLVWIDQIGVVRAITNSSQLTSASFHRFKIGDVIRWPYKTENTSFFNKALFTGNLDIDSLPNNRNRIYNYAAITSYTEGVGQYIQTDTDTSHNIYRFSYRNGTIIDLIFFALDLRNHIDKKDIVWNDNLNPARYHYNENQDINLTRDEWYQKNAICYERTFPLDLPLKKIKRLIINDINNLLGLQVNVDYKDNKPILIISNSSLYL